MTTAAGREIIATRLYLEEEEEAFSPVTHLAIGSGQTAATEADTSLEEEVLRKTITTSKVEGSVLVASMIAEKEEGNAYVEGDTQVTIREIGIYCGPVLAARIVLPEAEWTVKDDTLRMSVETSAGFGPVALTVDQTAPAALEGLSATVISEDSGGGTGSIRVSWDAPPETDIASYEVQRSVAARGYGGSGFMYERTLSDPSAVSFLAEDLAGSYTYYYRVRAVDTSDNAMAWQDAPFVSEFLEAPTSSPILMDLAFLPDLAAGGDDLAGSAGAATVVGDANLTPNGLQTYGRLGRQGAEWALSPEVAQVEDGVFTMFWGGDLEDPITSFSPLFTVPLNPAQFDAPYHALGILRNGATDRFEGKVAQDAQHVYEVSAEAGSFVVGDAQRFCFVSDGTEGVVYKNGVEVGRGPVGAPSFADAEEIHLMNSPMGAPTSDQCTAGLCKVAAIWGRAFTASEVSQLDDLWDELPAIQKEAA